LSGHLEHCRRWRNALVNTEEKLLEHIEEIIGLIEVELNEPTNGSALSNEDQ
jgi:hypothetical protein